MSKAGIEFAGFEELRAKLNKLGADAEQIATDALLATNDIVYKAALEAVQKANLPAGGKYSRGTAEKALRKEPVIEKKGTEIIAHVGFDIKKGGLPTIFMMYGTPYYMKSQKMYDAFFGQSGEIAAAQKAVYLKALEELEK